MKKVMFLFLTVVVVAVPVYASVWVGVYEVQIDLGVYPLADSDTVTVFYENTEPNNAHVRAFGIDITVEPPFDDPNADPHIVDVCELNAQYWVYPGSIDINEAGLVENVGTPVADPCTFPNDTLGGLDTNGITIEMASLYVGEANAPSSSGVLLKFVVDDNCKVSLSNNVSRGGVVMEGGGTPSGGTAIFVDTIVDLYIDTATIDEWRAVGRPKCWCRFRGGRQCHGDADNAPYGKMNYYVSVPEADVFNAGNSKPYSDLVDANGVHLVDPIHGIPLICGDADHLPYGKNNYRISVPEADIFNTYNSISGGPDPNCW